jgi:hypothetical protein
VFFFWLAPRCTKIESGAPYNRWENNVFLPRYYSTTVLFGDSLEPFINYMLDVTVDRGDDRGDSIFIVPQTTNETTSFASQVLHHIVNLSCYHTNRRTTIKKTLHHSILPLFIFDCRLRWTSTKNLPPSFAQLLISLNYSTRFFI